MAHLLTVQTDLAASKLPDHQTTTTGKEIEDLEIEAGRHTTIDKRVAQNEHERTNTPTDLAILADSKSTMKIDPKSTVVVHESPTKMSTEARPRIPSSDMMIMSDILTSEHEHGVDRLIGVVGTLIEMLAEMHIVVADIMDTTILVVRTRMVCLITEDASSKTCQ